MATVSSHILDSITGSSAAGIRVQLLTAGSAADNPIFDVTADNEGRISESIDPDTSAEYELVFYSAAYFSSPDAAPNLQQIMKTVVIRFVMPEATRRYHIPLMLAPHSYSIWWS